MKLIVLLVLVVLKTLMVVIEMKLVRGDYLLVLLVLLVCWVRNAYWVLVD